MISPLLLSLLLSGSPLGASSSPSSSSNPTNTTVEHYQKQKQCINNSPGPLLSHLFQRTCPLLVDDETSILTGVWAPWSIPPTCFLSKPIKRKKSPQNKTPLPPRRKLCTFTIHSHWAGGGLSILTTPQHAANLASIILDPGVPYLESLRGSPFRPAFFPPSRKPFEIRHVEGKGLGVFATVPIKRDTVLMVNTPVLLQLMDGAREWEVKDVFKLLHRAGNQLPKKEQVEMLQCAKKGTDRRNYIVNDIMETNTFDVSVDGVSHSGLYPEIARINHACKPNCFTRYSPNTLLMEVVAYKDIAPGEELSLSYAPLNILSKDRKELLKFWGFECTCALCRDAEATKVSDRQRNRIQRILEQFDNTKNLTVEKMATLTKEVEDLVLKEGMAGQIGDLYNIIGHTYLLMGEKKLAEEYGKLGVEKLRHYAGFDSERTALGLDFMKRFD
ncbi:N-lysine methyltransferase SMYD2 [Podospora australis]|uniref:N-lysine methyltransferase SMYD2 n=1 Tax=Podospora australis TaxID=1536484 RepID=A0AAN6WU01_9PEZI|nr:N-lysine methyltransferase SMYD2 [Podospora australis]